MRLKNSTFRKVIGFMVFLAFMLSATLVGIPGTQTFAATTATITGSDPVVKSCEPSANLITNADYETGSDFWGSWYGFGWGAPWPEMSATDAHSGTNSLKLGAASWSPSGASADVVIEPDTDYTFSVWYKAVNNGTSTFIYKFFFDTTNVIGSDSYFTIDGQWHQAAITFNSGDATKVAWFCWLNDNDTSSYLLLDDICLFETPTTLPKAEVTSEAVADTTCAAENNLIANGDAEGAVVGDYMNSSENFQYWGTTATDQAHGGTKSFQLNCESWGSWSGTRISPSIAMESGKEYTYSFWYKVVGPGAGDYTYKFGFANDSGAGYEYGSDHAVMTDGTWHQVAVTFNSGRAAGLSLYFFAAAADTKIYFDDFYLFESQYAIPAVVDTSVHATVVDEDPANKYCTKEFNLIQNYGMELGEIYWQNQKGYSWGALTVVNEDKKNGVNSLRFTPTLDETHPFSDSEFTISLDANTDYTFSVWLNAVASEQDPQTYFELRFPFDPASADVINVPLNFGAGWYQYAVTFNSGDRTSVIFNTGSTTENAVVYYDDFYLSKTADAIIDAPVNEDHPPYLVSARENNLVSNYNFESSDFSVWSQFSGWDFGLLTISDEVYRSGSHSLLYQGTTENDWQSTDLKFPLKPDTDYTISVWVNAVGGNNGILGVMGVDGTVIKWLTPQMQAKRDSGWYQISLQFNSKNYKEVSFYVGSAGSIGSGKIYLDDFYLFETVNGLASIPGTEDPDAAYVPETDPSPTTDPDSNPATGDSFPYASVLILITAAISGIISITKKVTVQ